MLTPYGRASQPIRGGAAEELSSRVESARDSPSYLTPYEYKYAQSGPCAVRPAVLVAARRAVAVITTGGSLVCATDARVLLGRGQMRPGPSGIESGAGIGGRTGRTRQGEARLDGGLMKGTRRWMSVLVDDGRPCPRQVELGVAGPSVKG